MITGQQLRTARERRGWTQEQLAKELGVTFRSVGNWERGEVPANREARIRDVLGGDLAEPGQRSNPLAAASNLALANEFVRRLEEAERLRKEQQWSVNQSGEDESGRPQPLRAVGDEDPDELMWQAAREQQPDTPE